MDDNARDRVCLQLFAKVPQPGKVKTRLIPDIGAKAATEVYRYCLKHNLDVLRSSTFQQQLWLNELDDDDLFQNLDVQIQRGQDLGEKMLNALRAGLAANHHVILMGSDCLQIDQALLQRVNQQLLHNELVIVPAWDGGYVLIGAAQHINPVVFEDIPWSTSQVLPLTLERCMSHGIKTRVLNPLWDIDHASDLAHYEALRHFLD